jgi:hypothetical protein
MLRKNISCYKTKVGVVVKANPFFCSIFLLDIYRHVEIDNGYYIRVLHCSTQQGCLVFPVRKGMSGINTSHQGTWQGLSVLLAADPGVSRSLKIIPMEE